MSDYKQTRDAAGNVTTQYDKMLRNFDDDLVKRLRDRRVCSLAQNSCRNDWACEQAADRIEELEAKLAKAEEALEGVRAFVRDLEPYADQGHTLVPALEKACTTLAELKGTQ